MIKNSTNIPLPMAVWLGADFYDHSEDPWEISATALLKPIRSVILGRRVMAAPDVDIASMVAQSVGTAIHMNIEEAWKWKLRLTLKKMGYPASVTEKIVINPEALTGDEIPIYMEIRNKKRVGKYNISGKFDFVMEGSVRDFKTTKVYGWIKGDNTQKYIQQGSIYRWLNPDIITSDTMYIDFLFTDWSVLGSKTSKKYPPAQIHSEAHQLMSIPETEHFIQTKLTAISAHENTVQEELPRCNKDDLWQKDTTYKYYKNPANKKRSTKNFDTMGEAMARLHADGNVGVVDEVKGEVVACRYCNALNSCTQAEEYILNGSLKI